MDETSLSQLKESIEEIKESQQKIASALLGSYEKNSIGLIEESRNQRRELDTLKAQQQITQVQLEETLQFKKDAKKIIAGLALVVPFLFELVKLGGSVLWELLKSK
jgi:transcription initiation factor TFIID subunit TAF12